MRSPLALAALLLSFCTLEAAERHVILVSIDGFSADAFADPKLAIPNLRRLVREGAAAARMTVVNPSVTWPNHTSMVTGVTPARHGVLYNGLAVRDSNGAIKIDPWRDKTEMVQAPTLYDAAFASGMTTAEVDWVAIWNARTITWSFREVGNPDGVIEREMVAAGLIAETGVAEFRKTPITWRDEIWTKAAIHILEKHKPNLLLFHLLATDSVQHRYGTKTLASSTALALADARLGELLAAIDRAGIRDSTTVFVTSDHGFKTYTRLIRARFEGAQIVPEGGTAMVYLNGGDPAKATAALAGFEGVERVISPAEYVSFGLPSPSTHKGMAELVAVAKDGYAFADSTGGPVSEELKSEQGAHGYPSTNPDMDGIFVAWGAAIRKGVHLDRTRTIDTAPTIAHILGLKLEGVEGQVLTQILRMP